MKSNFLEESPPNSKNSQEDEISYNSSEELMAPALPVYDDFNEVDEEYQDDSLKKGFFSFYSE